jgi:hypothetical protein
MTIQTQLFSLGYLSCSVYVLNPADGRITMTAKYAWLNLGALPQTPYSP